MPKVFVRRAIASGVSALGLFLAAGQAYGQTDTRWVNASGGNWSLAANWDTGVPSGNFNAIIDLLDPVDGYTINMDANFSIVGFAMTSPDATLAINNNTLTLSGDYLQQSGMITATLGGTGTIQTGIGQTATLRDTVLMHVASFQSRGVLNIDGNTLMDVCDTGIDHSGTGCNWTGNGDILMDGGASWIIGATGTFTAANDRTLFSTNPNGSEPTFTLNGIFEKNGSAGITLVDNIAFSNNGTVRATTGTLRVNQTTNFNAGILTGGAWHAQAGATLDLIGQNITTNRATITLDGVGSTFTQVNGLATNDTTGTFVLANTRSYTTAAPVFSNAGTLTIGTGSTFTVGAGNSFVNNGGTVNGGGLLVTNGLLDLQGGSLASVTVNNTSTTTFSGGTDITGTDTTFQFQGNSVVWSGGGDIVLNGASSLTNAAGSTFTINNAELIRSTNGPGTFPVFTNNGTVIATNTTPGTSAFTNVRLNNLGTMANPGVVEIQGGHILATPDVVNFSAGVLTGGRWRVLANSVLDFGTQAITTNRADVILRGGVASAQFPRLQNTLTNNDTLGKLTLEAGQTYTTAGNFTNLGTITVDGTEGASTFTIPLGSTLSNYTPVNKKLTGGRFIVIGQGRAAGAFEVPGLDIEIIDAEVTLSGVGANLVNTNNPDSNALRNLNTIDNEGKFTIRDGKSILTLGNFTVHPTGQLGVGMDSEFEVPANGSAGITNFNNMNGEFNDGVFEVRGGRVIAPNILVRILNNTVTLDGPGNVGFFRREGMELVNGFGTLERIGSVGINASLTISGGHELDLEPANDHDLSLLAGSSLTIGTAESPGGRLRVPREIEFPSPGGNFLQAGQLNMTGGLLQIEGNWIQQPGAQSMLLGSQVNVGGDFVQDGQMSINGVINAGGSFMVRGTIAGNATFNTGSGNFILQGGILSPGMSPGMMNIGGVADLVVSRGRFEMEIFGPVAGLDYDQVNIMHSLVLAGPDEMQLFVSLRGGYVPPLGATFDLITFAEGRTGDFTDVRLDDIGFGRFFERQDTGTSIRLVVVPGPGAGLVLSMAGLMGLRRRRRA